MAEPDRKGAAPDPREVLSGDPGLVYASTGIDGRDGHLAMAERHSDDQMAATGVSEAGRAALLDFAVRESQTVFYLADFGDERRTRFISDNVIAMTGFEPDDFVSTLGFGVTRIDERDSATYLEAMDRLSANSMATVEYRFRRRDGSVIWVRDTLRRTGRDSGEPDLVVGQMIDVTAEKEAIARSQDLEAIHDALLDSVLDAIIATDRRGTVVEFNASAERMFGYSRAEAIGQSIGDLIVPQEHLARHEAGMAHFQRTGRMHQQRRRMETAARDKDGRIFPVEVGITHTEIDGNPIVIGDIQDISDRIAARAERQRLTQLLQDAIGSMTEGFAISDPQDRIQFCNAAFADPYGVPADALIGRSMTDNIRAYFQNLRRFDGRLVEDAPEQIEWIVERLSSIDGSDIEMELKSGEWRQIRLHRTSDGGSVAIRTDISERKRSEQALLESERMVRRVLDASPIPVGMTYLDDGRIIYESPASRRLFMRHPLPEPVSARTFFADARDRDRYLERLKRDGAVDDFETRMKRTDGTEFPVTISARVVEYQGEQVIVSSTYDLTEVRRIEAEMARQQEALHQAEKLSAVGELLAGVSHELNNPLSVLVGQALLLKETASAPDVAARARRIGDAADRCARIVKTFLAMARQEPGDMIMLQVDEILTAVLEVVGYSLRAAGVEILTEVDPDLPAVVGDPSQLQQVITNLIVNAQHAMQETPPPNRLRLRAWWDAARDHVVLSVQDTGTGVPAHVATRMFEPFFTTKPVGDGTGIGLAIVLRIIESHGGSIVHESPAEGGSRFVVRLPAATERNATSQEPAQETREGTLRILVVDDVPFVAEIFREALTSDGHRVDVETSGQGALARLARQHYDAILCDVRMPHVDGPTLFKRLKEQDPAQAQVLAFITGDAMDRDTRRFLEGSGQPFLDKPVRPADLRNLVLQLAERQR